MRNSECYNLASGLNKVVRPQRHGSARGAAHMAGEDGGGGGARCRGRELRNPKPGSP